jgi:hypothetical protein
MLKLPVMNKSVVHTYLQVTPSQQNRGSGKHTNKTKSKKPTAKANEEA